MKLLSLNLLDSCSFVELYCSSRDAKDGSPQKLSHGGIPLANGDVQLQRPPPWAYPVWSQSKMQHNNTDTMLRAASQAIDRAMTHLWETKVKFVHVGLSVADTPMGCTCTFSGADCTCNAKGDTVSGRFSEAAVTVANIGTEQVVSESRFADLSLEENCTNQWVRVHLTAVPGVNMDEIEVEEPVRRKDHRRVPSTVAMAQVKVMVNPS